MKTYSRDQWFGAQEAWADGNFSDEWRNARHVMAMQGCIYPPAGSALDSWEDDAPSQRAVLIRAIRETPALLDRCMVRSGSWSKVIERLMRARDDWRDEMHLGELEERERLEDRADRRSAPMSIAAIFGRIADSAGIERETNR